MTLHIERAVSINAAPTMVWDVLTNPVFMKQWMGEPEMDATVVTDWKIGSPIIIGGFHHVKFENKGKILEYIPEKMLRYNFMSSLSRLPDKPESYTIVEFELQPEGNQTKLQLRLRNFPTDTIRKHLDLYWGPTLTVIREVVERR